MTFLRGLALGLIAGGFIATHFGFMTLALSGAGVGLTVIFVEEWERAGQQKGRKR